MVRQVESGKQAKAQCSGGAVSYSCDVSRCSPRCGWFPVLTWEREGMVGWEEAMRSDRVCGGATVGEHAWTSH